MNKSEYDFHGEQADRADMYWLLAVWLGAFAIVAVLTFLA